MDLRRTGNNILQIVFSLVLGGAILYWMYRGFDLNQVRNAMQYDMDWTWMLLSLPFGVTAQLFRGLRWCQTLEPIGEHARKHTAVNAIFLSYATSLVIPRVGEFLRCGVLKRYDGVAFPKALGTVVTERAVDAVVVAAITLPSSPTSSRRRAPASTPSSPSSPPPAIWSPPSVWWPPWHLWLSCCARWPFIIR